MLQLAQDALELLVKFAVHPARLHVADNKAEDLGQSVGLLAEAAARQDRERESDQ